jgi:hypothetical protein
MALALVSCADKFPAKEMFEIDIANETCGVYELTDAERVLWTHKEDRPLGSCDGVFGFSRSDTPKVQDWVRDRVEEAKEKCQ